MVEKPKMIALKVIIMFPQFPGKPVEKDWIVRATPVSPETQAPDELKANAVREQMISVSKKVPVMETSACFPGWLVFAAAATIGALPIPDSLEKRPRATPKRMVWARVAPANPPVAAVPEKACSKINTIPELRWDKLLSITMVAPIK